MWQILIHPLIFGEDFKKIGPHDRQQIVKAIRKKLTKDPKAYGKALTGDLKGYWRLRVRDYRVIYSIEEKRVLIRVVKVGIRKDAEVYETMIQRITKLIDFTG